MYNDDGGDLLQGQEPSPSATNNRLAVKFTEYFSARGERTLFHAGYKFSLHQSSRMNPGMQFWRCTVRRPMHCKGRIEVQIGTCMGRVTNPQHWHPPNYSRAAELVRHRRYREYMGNS